MLDSLNSRAESSDDSLDKSLNNNSQVNFEATEEPGHEILFYPEEVEVEKSSADSAQSVVYFGREATL